MDCGKKPEKSPDALCIRALFFCGEEGGFGAMAFRNCRRAASPSVKSLWEGGRGRTFLKKGPPRPSQPLPTPSQDFHPYRIPLHSFSNVCKAVPFWCIFRESKDSRIVALSGSPYMKQPGNFRSGKPVSSPSSANRPAYKSLWKGRDGVWGREGKAFLQKSFPSLPQSSTSTSPSTPRSPPAGRGRRPRRQCGQARSEYGS